MVSIPITTVKGPAPHATFRATPGSRLKDADARIIGEVVSEIIEEKGDVRPADVVEAATPEDAPLHKFFTWDNELAARQHRLDQARRLLRGVQIEIEYRAPDGSRGREWTRGFQNVRVPGAGPVVDGKNPPSQRVYVPITYARNQPQLMSQIVQEAAKHLWSWHAKYRQYAAIAEFNATFGRVFEVLDEIANPSILDDQVSDDESMAEDPALNLEDEDNAPEVLDDEPDGAPEAPPLT